jgi:hypothetical protein
MNRLLIWGALAFALAAGPALAQSQQPYAGLEGRSIKALSEQQIADLRAGRGMGLALVAELNGYPGPIHVLELAHSLELSDQQRAKMQELFAAMKAEAVPLGDRLIAQEAELDKQFASNRHGGDRHHACNPPAHAPQIPLVHRRGADASAGSALRRTSRL